MAKVGNLAVAFTANTAQFTRGVNGARDSVIGFRGAVAGAKTAMAGFGRLLSIAAIIAVGKKVVNLAGEQEHAERRLAGVLRATGNAAGFTAEQLQKEALAIQSVTAVADQEVLAVQAVLATFKELRGETFKQATRAVLDMAAAMGQDARSAAIQLGKALNDPIRGVSALREVGVSFNDQQMEMIAGFVKSNNLMAAQQVILAELSSEFGGVAEAVSKGAGAFAQLGNEIGFVAEKFGRLIALPFQEFAHLTALGLIEMRDPTPPAGSTLRADEFSTSMDRNLLEQRAGMRGFDSADQMIASDAAAADRKRALAQMERDSMFAGRFLRQVAMESETMIAQVDANTAAAKASMAQRVTLDVLSMMRDLRSETNALVMSEREMSFARLASIGATDSQVRSITDLIDTLDMVRKSHDAAAAADGRRQQMMSRGQGIFAETRNPMERHIAELRELRELYAGNAIDIDTLTRAMFASRDRLADSIRAASSTTAATREQRPAALERGSVAAFSAGRADNQIQKPLNNIANNTAAQVRIFGRALDKLSSIDRNIANQAIEVASIP